MKRRLVWLLCLVVLTASSLYGVAVAETLRVSAIPDEDPQELLRKYKPFADYIAKEVGVKVKFVPVLDYAATVEGLAANRLDIVWYGGFTSVQAVERAEGGHAAGHARGRRELQERFRDAYRFRHQDPGGPQGQDLCVRQRQLHIRTPHAASLPQGGGNRSGAGLQEVRLQRRP